MEQTSPLTLTGRMVSTSCMAESYPPARSPVYAYAKRFMDVSIVTAALIITWPLLAFVALGILLTAGGPILFRQKRLGKDGRTFTLLKFRSMKVGSWDSDHQTIVRQQIFAARTRRKEQRPLQGPDRRKSDFKSIPVERLTAIGRFLRKTGLDELPQLLNVLKGDMSLVGPRPPIPYELLYRTDEQRRRLAVVPGLTGLWQTSGWSQLNYAEMMQADLDYIERQSIALDLQILFRTPRAILTSWQR